MVPIFWLYDLYAVSDTRFKLTGQVYYVEPLILQSRRTNLVLKNALVN
jgi:hypothetical protein